MNDSAKTDIFPARITDPADVRRLPDNPDFHAIVSSFRIFAFIIYMNREEIVYYKPVDWNARYQKHFTDTGAYVRTLRSVEEKPWSWAARKLKKDVAENLRKNIDPRTCFKYEYNYFLVKSCFTPGQRTVQPGTQHVYQIGAVQMVFYFVQPLYQHRIQKRVKLFPAEQQYMYSRRDLRPGQCYAVPENTVYVLFATNKCFFSVHVLRSDVQPPFPCKDPLREATKRPAPVDMLYRRPVPTPLIEDAVLNGGRGEEEEEDLPPSYESLFDRPSTSADLFDRPSTSAAADLFDRMNAERVLLRTASGQEVTDDMMMPPPCTAADPPPPYTSAVEPTTAVEPTPQPVPTPQTLTITLATFPLDKTVRVVAPETVSWYREHFKMKEYPDPREPIWDLGLSDQSEPMNLSTTADHIADSPPTVDLVADSPLPIADQTEPLNLSATSPNAEYVATTPSPTAEYVDTTPSPTAEYVATTPSPTAATTPSPAADHIATTPPPPAAAIEANVDLDEMMKAYASAEAKSAITELFNSFAMDF